MGIFSWLTRNNKPKAPPPSDDFWYNTPQMKSASGIAIDEKTALKYLTVYGCVSLIAGDIAKLPLQMYRKRKDGGKDIVTDHFLYDILHNAPTEEVTSFNWREAAQGHLLLWGNTYSYIERDFQNRVKALHLISDPGKVEVERINGTIVYIYDVVDTNGQTKKVKRTRNEIFHIPGYSFNGLVGMSPISAAKEAVGLGVAAETFGSSYFGQGTHPAGIMEMDGSLGDGREDYIKVLKKGYAGLGNAHNIMVLENGMKYKTMTIPLEDAQFLETRDHQKIEICGMYHVPPHKIAIHGQNSNYNNLEQENASYVDSCLMGWLVRWESIISQQLLTKQERMQGLFFEFNVAGLLRGDSAARSDYYSSLFNIGSFTPNEIRAKENMNPIEGGDQAYVQLNMVPLDMVEEILEPDEPPAEPTEPPEGDVEDLKRYFNRSDDGNILILNRLQASYKRLIRKVAQEVINKETKAIMTAVKKIDTEKKSTRAAWTLEKFEKWLDEFYGQHETYVRNKFAPVFTAYMENIQSEASRMIGPGSEMTPEMNIFVNEYIDRYTSDHVKSGKGQIISILVAAGFAAAVVVDAVIIRMEEWHKKRAGKISRDESVRALNAMSRESWKSAGVTKMRWVTVGKSCPFCIQLDGKVVGINRKFLNAGAVIHAGPDGEGKIDEDDSPKGEEWQTLKVYRSKAHAPIHQGCDCKILPA